MIYENETAVMLVVWLVVLFGSLPLVALLQHLWYKNRTFFHLTYTQLFKLADLMKDDKSSNFISVSEKTGLVYGTWKKHTVLALKKGNHVQVIAKKSYANSFYVPKRYQEEFANFLAELKR